MGDAQKHTWGVKYALRKAVNRLTGPKNCEKWAKYGHFAQGETQAATAEDARSGAKRVAGRRRLSVCLLRTTRWLTRNLINWVSLDERRQFRPATDRSQR